MMLIDMHVHSHFSAGVAATPEEILRRAVDVGLDGVAFVERGASRCAPALVEAGRGQGVKVFVGVELPTDRGVLLCFPRELDDAFVCEEWRALTATGKANAQAVIDHFRSRGGAVVAATPYDLELAWPMGDHLFGLEGLAAVEGYVPRLSSGRNAFAVEAALSMGLPQVGGSDYRGGDELGIGATVFSEPVGTQAELVEALLRGQCWAAAVGVHVPDEGSREGDREDRGGRERGGRDDRGGRDRDRGGRDRGGREDRGGRDRGERGERDRGERDRGDRDRGDRDRGERRGGRPGSSERSGGRMGGGRSGGGRSGGGGGGGRSGGPRGRR